MNKYKNIKTVIDGITFDSKKEANRYAELKLLQRSGVIAGLELQKKFVLVSKNTNGREQCYIADFCYMQNGERVVEDVKSKATVTPLYRLKKRLLKEIYNIDIKEIF